MNANVASIALALSALVGIPASAQVPADGSGMAGIYAGSYRCQDGEHGVMLDLKLEPRPAGNGLRVTGTLGFFPVLAGAGGSSAQVAGSFSILGVVLDDGRISFRHQEWLLRPDGYGAANFNGRISQRGDGLWQITGRPLAGPNSDFCSELLATRFLP
jgi:hypothetical protein